MMSEKLSWTGKALREFRTWRIAMADARTPKTAKILIWAAILYLASPIDLISDVFLIVGFLDDLLIVTILILTAMNMVPREVWQEAREAAGR